MGGEKLKHIHSAFAVFFTAAILVIGISQLSAQEQDLSETAVPLSGAEAAALSETAIVLPAAPDAAVSGGPAVRSAEAEIVLGEALPGPVPSGGSRLFAIIRMVLVLALAAAAVYGVVFFLRRSASPQNERNSQLKVLTGAHLGSNRYVYVVNVGTRAWLLGAGEGGVSLISELTDQEAIDAMVLEESRRNSELTASRFADFRAMLARFTGRRAGVQAVGTRTAGGRAESSFSAQTLRKQRERLKGL